MLDRIQRSADLSTIANYARSSPTRGGGGGLSVAEVYQINQLDAVRKIGSFGLASSSSDLSTQFLAKRIGASADVKISAAARTQSALADFETQLQALNLQRNPLKVQSSQSELLTAKSIQGGQLQPAVSVEVAQLAQSQQTQSRNFSPAEAQIGLGQLVIQRASLAGDARPLGEAVTINITEQNNTLAGIAQSINSSGATIRAEVLRDSAGSRLLLTGKATGQEQGFVIRALDRDGNDTDDAGLSALNFDPSTGQVATRTAQDALLTIDMREMRSADNQIMDPVSQLQLEWQDVGRVTLTYSRETEALTTNFSDLVQHYNQVRETLLGIPDMTANKVRRQLSESLDALSAGQGLARLDNADIGLIRDAAGKLSLNEARLSQQVSAQPESVNELFNLLSDKLTEQVSGALDQPGSFVNILRGFRETATGGLRGANGFGFVFSNGADLNLPLNLRSAAGVLQYAQVAQLQ